MSKRVNQSSKQPGGGRAIWVEAAYYNCPAFINLSPYAVKVLMAVLAQYRGNNNGKLLPGIDYMRTIGMDISEATLSRVKKELRETDLVIQTRAGRLAPGGVKITEWWAVTCFDLNWNREMDIAENTRVKGIYKVLPAIKMRD